MNPAGRLIKRIKPNQSIRSVAHGIERHALRLIETAYDLRYNIHTRTDDVKPAFADDEGYDPVSYPGMKHVQTRVGIKADDVVFDIGCGRGRALCLLSRHPAVAACVGIEYHAGHAKIARRNAERLRGKAAPISIIEGDAAQQNYDRSTLLLLYNPFGEATMRQTLDRVGQSLRSQPRAIRIVYVNPKFEHVLAEQHWLTKVEAFSIPNRIHRSLPASLWHSLDPIPA